MRKSEYTKKGVFWKNFFKNFSIIMLILISAGLVYFSVQGDVDLRIIQSEEQQLNESRMVVISENYTSIITDLLFLSEQNELHSFIENPDLYIKSLIMLEYEFMLKSKKVYRQIRYIDEFGDVIAGANYVNGETTINTSKDNLSNEDFFIETMNLNKGEVFTSPIFFTEEKTDTAGIVRPVIHFATLVYSLDEESKGVVLLDYMAEDLLNKLQITSVEISGSLFLTYADGAYILYPQNDLEYPSENSFLSSKSFADDFPYAWEQISSNKEGQFINEMGVFTFDSMNPEIMIDQMDLKDLGFSGLAISPEMVKEHEMKIISYYPIEKINNSRNDLIKEIIGYLGIGMPVILFVSFIAARLSLLQKQTEEAENLTSKVFDSTKEGMFITNVNAVFINVNQSFSLLTGYSRAELIGKTPEFLIPENQKQNFHEIMINDLMPRKEWEGELIFVKKDKTPFYVNISVNPMLDENNKVTNYIAVVNDITEKKNAEKYLQFLATHDVLTQLPNRAMLYNRIDLAISNSKDQGQYAAVFFIDIDGFKKVNDTYGHPTGDLLLQEIAERLKNNIRDGDTISRISGDEFACVFEKVTSPEAAKKIGEKLLSKLKSDYKIQKRLISISASIGISLFPDDGENAEILLKKADQAMYEIKKRSKSNVILFSEINHQKNL